MVISQRSPMVPLSQNAGECQVRNTAVRQPLGWPKAVRQPLNPLLSPGSAAVLCLWPAGEFWSIRAAISGRRPSLIMFSSARPGEGKTMVYGDAA
jgi:hypothetical protein